MKKKILIFLFFVSVLAVLIFLLSSGTRVTGVFPSPNNKQVDILVKPYVNFSKSISKREQNNFSVKSSPEINFSLYWSENGKTLYLVPSGVLSPGTSYDISVRSPKISYMWGFKTVGSSLKFDQGILDREYNQALQKFYLSHPWYEKLPPRNDDFFIGFDASKNEFFVDLYPKNNSAFTIEEQTNQLKNRVLQTLRSIGVDTSFYKIVWIVSPR